MMTERVTTVVADECAGFRETTLYLFRQEDADSLRHFGRLLHGLVLEGDPYFGEPEDSLTRRELGAALLDMLHVRNFLWHVSREVEESQLDAEDARLSLLAAELTGAIDRVIDLLQEGMA